MAEQAIEKFDPLKLVEQVRARVQGAFADLIPEATWNEMVTREVKSFMDVRLKDLVAQELQTFLKPRIQAFLASPECTAWSTDLNRQVCGPLIEKMIVDHAPVILGRLLSDSIGQVVQQLRYR